MNSASVTCPDDETLLTFLEGSARDEEQTAITLHLSDCVPCREVVADLARESSARGEKHAGDRAGRYVILTTVGAGAMGVVYAAYDRELGRKVALKFLHATGAAARAGPARDRLVREAQSLARLAHPNVITIHDVGVLDGEVFLAMEFVEGMTLRAWLAKEPRAVDAIVRALRQAGEGLAAAHAAGLVHRDFKPDNVLVGDDGRVRVTDFGLARSASGAPTEESGGSIERDPSMDRTLTKTGALLGTPAYMAPEQKRRETPDARSDVYAFAIVFEEAVTGARPGEARTPKRRAPAWVERIVARGLRESPDDRWPSMRALLDAMDRGAPITASRALALLAVGAVVAFGIVAFGRASPPLCPRDEHAFDGVWDGARKSALEATFLATQRPNAGPTFTRIAGAIDAYKSEVTLAEVASCEATRVRGQQSTRLFDLRAGCIQERKRALGTALDVLAAADGEVVDHAVEIVSGVPRVASCENVRSLESVEPPPEDPSVRARIVEADAKLDEARALNNAGKPARALATVEPVVQTARSLGYAPLLARALLGRANALYDSSTDVKAINATLRETVKSALEARDDATAAAAWTFLINVDERSQATLWSDLAAAEIQRLGGDDLLEAERLTSLARVETAEGHGDVARALLARARPLFEKTRGPEYFRIASVDQLLGNVALDQGRFDEAIASHRRALDLRLKLFGKAHMATLSSTFNEAEDLLAMHDPSAALVILREIEVTLREMPGVSTFWLHHKYGEAHRLLGDAATALREDRLSAELALHDEGESNHFASCLERTGEDLLILGRPREALEPLERALALGKKLEDDGVLAEADRALARATWDLGDHVRALAFATDCRPHAEKSGWTPAELAKLDAWVAARAPKPR